MKIVSIVALFLVGIVTAAGAVSAFGGMFRNAETDEAIENDDFAGWKAAIESGLTEERFQEISSRHQARGMKGPSDETRQAREAFRESLRSGDYSAYLAACDAIGREHILSEDGYSVLTTFHESLGGDAMRAHGILRQAVLDGDYDAYVDAAETIGAVSVLTENEFDSLAGLHASMGFGKEGGMGRGRFSRHNPMTAE